ncbi:MAG: hypothetical protein ABW000_11565 [Actinoplanes sp.]
MLTRTLQNTERDGLRERRGTAYAVTGTANAIANGELVPEGKYSFSVKLTMAGGAELT